MRNRRILTRAHPISNIPFPTLHVRIENHSESNQLHFSRNSCLISKRKLKLLTILSGLFRGGIGPSDPDLEDACSDVQCNLMTRRTTEGTMLMDKVHSTSAFKEDVVLGHKPESSLTTIVNSSVLAGSTLAPMKEKFDSMSDENKNDSL